MYIPIVIIFFGLVYFILSYYDKKRISEGINRKEKLYMKAINEDLIDRFKISDDMIRDLNKRTLFKNTNNFE
jgi:hypothetical protein